MIFISIVKAVLGEEVIQQFEMIGKLVNEAVVKSRNAKERTQRKRKRITEGSGGETEASEGKADAEGDVADN